MRKKLVFQSIHLLGHGYHRRLYGIPQKGSNPTNHSHRNYDALPKFLSLKADLTTEWRPVLEKNHCSRTGKTRPKLGRLVTEALFYVLRKRANYGRVLQAPEKGLVL
jgi:hypothetical protein